MKETDKKRRSKQKSLLQHWHDCELNPLLLFEESVSRVPPLVIPRAFPVMPLPLLWPPLPRPDTDALSFSAVSDILSHIMSTNLD